MDIEAFIKEEAPNDDEHDKAYAKALRSAYEVYKDLPLINLKYAQKFARQKYDGCHESVAQCMVLYELIKDGGSV